MGRLCPNVRRRFGAYWFTKKLKTAAGWKAIEFSLKIREPQLAIMVGAQVNAQFHLLSPLAVSGTISIKQFQIALAEIAANVARARRQAQFEFLTGQREHPDSASVKDFSAVLIDGDIKAGRFLELVARYGNDMKDANFFIEILDRNGFSDDDIRTLLIEFYGQIDSMLAPFQPGELATDHASALEAVGFSQSHLGQPFIAKAVLATTGKSMMKAAEAAAADNDIIGIDALVDQALQDSCTATEFAAVTPAPTCVSPAPSAPILSVEEHPFFLAGQAYIRDAQKYHNLRDSKDAAAITRLFSEFLIENAIYELVAIRQSHIAAFRALFDRLPTHWGKSSSDTCLADYRKRGEKLPAKARGISGATWNKHVSGLNQIFNSIRAAGQAIGAPGELLEPSRLRAKRSGRGRGKRVAFTTTDLQALFALPCFTGCAGWRRQDPFTAGDYVFHRALYFVPMLLAYTGARRDEICGLLCQDIILDDTIPHIYIRENVQRRLKNAQSERKIPLHSEILRLGFSAYVGEIKRLGFDLLFPDLFSATTTSPLGDRLYDEIVKGLISAVPEDGARKKVLHSLRHTVGAKLKDDGIISEVRADLLGHGGSNVTEEVYSGASELALLRDVVDRLPKVTEHLTWFGKIQLLPWVSKRQPAPWGRARRR